MSTISRDFRSIDDYIYGNCFTFNHQWRLIKNVTRIGAKNGLRLLLFVNASQYLPTTERVGVRFTIHNKDEFPFPVSISGLFIFFKHKKITTWFEITQNQSFIRHWYFSYLSINQYRKASKHQWFVMEWINQKNEREVPFKWPYLHWRSKIYERSSSIYVFEIVFVFKSTVFNCFWIETCPWKLEHFHIFS